MNEKIYLHEIIDIILQGRPKYFHHMTTVWGPVGRKERNMLCVGVWGTLGSTARWPEVINLWEFDGWDGIAANFAHEVGGPTMQDPNLKVWWDEAQKYRSGGFDRLLIPAPYCPTVADICKDGNIVGAKVFYHERIAIQPGQAKGYLSAVEQEWRPVAKELGLHLTGAYRTAMRNDSECILIWAIRDWPAWARVEKAYESDPRVAVWRRRTQGLALDWFNSLMISAPASTTQTGVVP
jgi:hypothetical protein